MKWVTSDHRVIDICDMNTGHLINSIAYLWRVRALQSRKLGVFAPPFGMDVLDYHPVALMTPAQARMMLINLLLELQRRDSK